MNNHKKPTRHLLVQMNGTTPDNAIIEEFNLDLMLSYECMGNANVFDNFESFLGEQDVTFPCQFNSNR